MSTPLWSPETISVACLNPYLDVIVPFSNGFTKLNLFFIYVTSSSLSLELVVSSPPPTPVSAVFPLFASLELPLCPSVAPLLFALSSALLPQLLVVLSPTILFELLSTPFPLELSSVFLLDNMKNLLVPPLIFPII